MLIVPDLRVQSYYFPPVRANIFTNFFKKNIPPLNSPDNPESEEQL